MKASSRPGDPGYLRPVPATLPQGLLSRLSAYLALPPREFASRVLYRIRRAIGRDAGAVDYQEWIRRFDHASPGEHAQAGASGVHVLDFGDDRPADHPVLPGFDRSLLQEDPSRWPPSMTRLLVVGPDRRLHPQALAMLVAALDASGCQLAFADEDRINDRGARLDPYFKPAWDQDLLLEQDYVSGLFLVDRSVLESASRRPLPGLEAQYALALRLSRLLDDGQVTRVPHVLSHLLPTRRQTSDGRAAALADWLLDDADDSLARLDLREGSARIRWVVPAPAPRVSVVIPTRDQPELLRVCLQSLTSVTRYPNLEIVLVDNGTTDPAALAVIDEAANSGAIVVRRDEPFNFSALVNAGVAVATGSVVCLLNNDVEARDGDWLDEMVALACRPGTGVVGAMLMYPDGNIQHAGILVGMHGAAANLMVGEPLGTGGQHGRAHSRQGFCAVTAACIVLRKAVFESVGGFDAAFEVCFNDVDFCLRVRAEGHSIVWTPDAVLVHRESATRGTDVTPAKVRELAASLELLRSRWRVIMQDDPSYNPNLALGGRPFSVSLMDPVRAHFFPGSERVR